VTDPRRGRYLALFAAESRTLLAGARRSLRDWGETPADASHGDAVFRALHTVKGMAASLEFQSLVDQLHDAETELAQHRGSAVPVAVDWLVSFGRVLDRLSVATEEAAGFTPRNASAPTVAATSVVRVDLSRLDALLDELGGLVTARQELARHAAGDPLRPVSRAAVAMTRRLDEVQNRILDVRLAPLTEILEPVPPMARELARQLGKEVTAEITGDELEVDRGILAVLPDAMMHLVRNAIDHGIELPDQRRRAGKPAAGRISIRARQDGESVVVTISDDGRGIDRQMVAERAIAAGILQSGTELGDNDLLGVLARPGFSTASTVSEVSGRGVGLDTVVARLHGVGAALSLTSVTGRGSIFTIRLPMLVTGIGTERYVMPLTQVSELVAWDPDSARIESGRTVMELRGSNVPVVDLRRLLLFRGPPPPMHRPAVVCDMQGQRIALIADEIVGQVDAVVQAFDRPAGLPRWVGGATVLDDGRPALMLDLAGVM
jgi:two-component system chemotaxis sensor kinase CheA